MSEYPPIHKHRPDCVITSFNRTHLCTFIHKLKGQLMVVGNHLLKDESKTDSHSECEVTTAQNIQNKPKKEEESLGI